MKKRIFSWVMAIAMVMSLIPSAAFATGDGAVTDEAGLKTALEAGGTVTLGANIVLTETLTIPADKTVTLDLGAYTITGADAEYGIYVNDAESVLTLNATTGGVTAVKAAVFVTEGKATINGGNYISSANDTIEATIYAQSFGGSSPEIIINGGTFESTGQTYVVRSCSSTANGNSKITINDGTFEAKGAWGTVVADCLGVIDINGGTFKSAGVWSSSEADVLFACDLNGVGNGEINVAGGTFVGQNPANASISATEKTSYVVEGYTSTQSGDSWIVADNRVAQIGETKYATLADAVAVGGEITLLKDVALDQVITVTGKNVTIKADSSKTITANVEAALTVGEGGTLTLGKNVRVINQADAVITPVYAQGGALIVNGADVTAHADAVAIWATGTGSTVTVESGNIVGGGTLSAIDGAAVTLNGGRAESGEKWAGINANGTNSTVTITGGTIAVSADNAVKAENGGKITISGGTVETTNPALATIVGYNNGTVEISGGVINGGFVKAVTGTITVSGGMFSVDPTAYVAEGYIVKVADSKYQVIEKNALTAGVYTTDPTEYLAAPFTVVDTANGLYTVDYRTYTVTFVVDETTSYRRGFNHGWAISQAAHCPTKEGYTFSGWYTDADLTTAYDFATRVTADMTLYAKWTEIPSEPDPEPDYDYTPVTPSTTTTTKKNDDGSTTTTTTNKVTGTVTEVTQNTDGSTNTVVTKKDGTVTETNKTADGVIGTVVTDKTGEITEITASISASAAKDADETETVVALPIAPLPVTNNTETAATVEISVPAKVESVAVEIPVENVTPGTVVVLVDEDGNETVVNTTGTTENGVVIQVEGHVTVKVVENSKDFKDVSAKDWYNNAADFVSSRELMNGMTEDSFGHDVPTSRAMVAQILHNMEGKPANAYTGSFDDVGANDWYADAIHWAAEEGIISGTGNGNFAPNDYVTREQLAVMIWKYAGAEYSNHYIGNFKDCGEISSYAEMAMRWAVENGLMSGKGNGQLDPKGNATRAEVASVLMVFYENVKY